MHKFYNRYIKPLSKETDQAEREVVLNWILVGIIGLSVIAFIDTLVYFAILHEIYLAARLLSIGALIGIVSIMYLVSRYRQQERAVSLLLVGVIIAIASLLMLSWGIPVPTAVGLFCLAVVMAGILISARGAFYAVGCIVILIFYLQYAISSDQLHPDLTWMKAPSTVGDVVGFSAIFLVIALVSWLFNRQMELSLKRAQRSERALQRQKTLLEVKIAQRTQQLEVAQLEKMQHLYRFAELGRLSTALFHDLANHLTNVSLDIEGLKTSQQSDIMHRIQENVGHIDVVVQRVRQQLQGKAVIEVFNVMDEVAEVIKIAEYNARQPKVLIQVESDFARPIFLKGDTTRFRQVLLNLISNAVEAYYGPASKATPPTVTVSLSRQQTTLCIAVHDMGGGISPTILKQIFAPFYTTKDKGIGIGLFIVKQIVENDFGGTIEATSTKNQGTAFIVKLPKSHYAPKSSN